MARMSEQVQGIALSVCDRLALFEDRAATTASESPAPAGGSSTGIADSRGAGSAFFRPLSTLIDEASDSELQSLLQDAARARSEFDGIIAAGAGIVAKRSERALGSAGLAQSAGDGTAVGMVQRLTGSTKTEAFRQVKLGGAMGEADAASVAVDGGTAPVDSPDFLESEAGGTTDAAAMPGRPAPVVPWHEPLTRAAREGVIRTEAVTVMMRGLGEPHERLDEEALRRAAEELVASAAGVHADELGRRARQLRDEIDPEGVGIRWDQRYSNRSWRFGRNPDGARTAWVQFDEESAAWADAIVGAAMRPRRGGPRFVDPDEAERAEKLRLDPRSNDQIVFDVMMDLLRAGAEADPTLAFGSRQPGVRVIVSENCPRASGEDAASAEASDLPSGGAPNVGNGYFEETGEAVPRRFIERQVCISGTTTVRVDRAGTPLDVGREQRLFTPKLRIALAIRDGGCQMLDCDSPPSYTEAHHIHEWAAEGGRTDLADGILVCRRCHMLIHNNGWKITREGTDYFAVPPPSIDPEQKPIPLRKKSRLAWRSSGEQPPPGVARE